MPRAARTEHQAHRRLQAAVGGRRLLARRRQPPDAHTGLRHGLLQQGGARRVPRAARAGAGARPPQARPRARPVRVLTGLAGLDLLAAEGHARCSTRSSRSTATCSRSAATSRSRRRSSTTVPAVGDLRALGQVQGQHLRLGVRGPRVRPQADELPGPLPALRAAAVVLSRPSGALRGAGPPAPPRAQRHPPRPAARAPLHPGRRPHLLHGGADPGRGHEDAWPSPTRSTGCSTSPCTLELSTRPDERLGDDALWDHAEGALAKALERQRHRVLDRRGRGRLLRPEDRPAHDRLARALMAARHGPARLQHARALRADLHGRRQRGAHAR